VFVPDKIFLPRYTFVGKSRRLPKSGAPERCSFCIVYNFTPKHQTRVDLTQPVAYCSPVISSSIV